MKKKAASVEEEKCDIEIDEIKNVFKNKTITLIKKVKDCKQCIGVSIYFYLK